MWGPCAPAWKCALAVLVGGLVPYEGRVRCLVGAFAQEHVFAGQGFFVVSKTEHATSIVPFGVGHHLGGWRLGHGALS